FGSVGVIPSAEEREGSHPVVRSWRLATGFLAVYAAGNDTAKGETVKRIVLAILACTAAAALADEGMWMPQQVPQLAAEMQKMGIKIDPNRFADLTGDPMGAVISLGGCSASFVSPDGLVVTNHHCGFGALQFNSTPQRDLITNGFLARTREEELQAGPG